MIWLKKNWKNQIFSIFLSKSMLTICLRPRVSLICAKKFEIWVNLCFGNILKLKVTKGELIISIHVEMADELWCWCPVRTPLSLIRVKPQRLSYLLQMQKLNILIYVDLTLFYMGGGSNRPPLADYCTLILGGCPEWTDFSWLCSFQY